MAQAAPKETYFIGNSLSWDILLEQGLDRIATQGSSFQIQTSQHIRCGSSLTNTVGTINDSSQNAVCTPTGSLGIYPDALTLPLDFLVLQPFNGSTVGEEINTIKALSDLVKRTPGNENTRVFIFAAWGHNLFEGNYLATWKNHQASLAGEFVPSKSTYELVKETLARDGYDVGFIPAGEAFAIAAERLAVGSIGNLQSDQDLYRDTIVHASNAGRYLAALTAYSALTGLSPENIPDANANNALWPFQINGYGTIANAQASAELRQIAATVTSTPEPSALAVLIATATMVYASRHRTKLV